MQCPLESSRVLAADDEEYVFSIVGTGGREERHLDCLRVLCVLQNHGPEQEGEGEVRGGRGERRGAERRGGEAA